MWLLFDSVLFLLIPFPSLSCVSPNFSMHFSLIFFACSCLFISFFFWFSLFCETISFCPLSKSITSCNNISISEYSGLIPLALSSNLVFFRNLFFSSAYRSLTRLVDNGISKTPVTLAHAFPRKTVPTLNWNGFSFKISFTNMMSYSPFHSNLLKKRTKHCIYI